MEVNTENNDNGDFAVDAENENSVTMVDVLKGQEAFEEHANAVLGGSDDKECTYTNGYVKRQALYACLTCCADARIDSSQWAGICLACSLSCHENHNLVELYTKRNFRCDCGGSKFPDQPCMLNKEKINSNDDNVYNQNFGGLYCICHRPYPDPESTEDDEMIQCIICEDWLHSKHLNAVVPSNDDYSEMICEHCMEKKEFLYDYTIFAVENQDISVDLENSDVGLDQSTINDTINTNGDAPMEDKEIEKETKKDDDKDLVQTDVDMSLKEENEAQLPNDVSVDLISDEESKLVDLVSQVTELDKPDHDAHAEKDADEMETDHQVENKELPDSTNNLMDEDTNDNSSSDKIVTETDQNNGNQPDDAFGAADKIVSETDQNNTNQPDNAVDAEQLEMDKTNLALDGSDSVKPKELVEKENDSEINIADNQTDDLSMQSGAEDSNKNTDLDDNHTSDNEKLTVGEEKSSGDKQSEADLKKTVVSSNDECNKESLREDTLNEQNEEKSDVDLQDELVETHEENVASVTKATQSNESSENTEKHVEHREEASVKTMDDSSHEPMQLNDIPSDNKSGIDENAEQTMPEEIVHSSENNVSETKNPESECTEKVDSNELPNKMDLVDESKDEINDDVIKDSTTDESNKMESENTSDKELEKNETEAVDFKEGKGYPDESEEKAEKVLDKKRKFVLDDLPDTLSNSKKCKLESKAEMVSVKCRRPENSKKSKGATFWPCNWRKKLCSCINCVAMYRDINVLFLLDDEDTVSAYEDLGKFKCHSSYEKGLKALSTFDRIQQINALTEYNKMKDKLLDFLKSFKEKKEVVKEEDIKKFFAGMKPKRESDGVYFCR